MSGYRPRFDLLTLTFVFAAASFLGPSATQGQEPNRQLVQTGSPPAATSVNRIALVIGNGAYTNAPPLKNPPNDARDMAATLKLLGFSVSSAIDADQRTMKRLIREFGQQLKGGGQGLFYYAGHGVQMRGRNYLIPANVEITSEADVEDQAVDLNLVLGLMDEAQNGLNIVILDACRNNPFTRSFRSAGSGLAQVDAPTGTLIAYATSPGRVASDGQGRNGLYTAELLNQMRVNGIGIEEMFKRVRAEVQKRTSGQQVPWESSSLIGNFYFTGGSSDSLPVNSTAKIDPVAFELSYWETIKNSTNADDFKAYLARYPQGQFVELAKNRITTLQPAIKPAETSTPASAGQAEITFWDSIKNSNIADDYRAYLEKYPNGEFAGLAKRRLAPLEAAEKEKETRAADPLAGTVWTGKSSGGDKQYEFRFLPNSEVVWNLKWGRLNDPTFRGTYTRTGNEIHMVFDATTVTGGKEQVAAVLSQDSLTGSWNFGRSEVRPENGMYKFTVTKSSSSSTAPSPNPTSSLEGTVWKGDSDGGDKHYEFHFLPDGKVVEYLKMAQSLTNNGTWYQNGNAIHMEFPDYYPVEALLEGNRMTGSWKNGAYKFTIFKTESASNQNQTSSGGLEGWTWKGDSSGGDKHYEFQFLANGEVRWNLGWNGNKSYKGTWRQAGNTVTMDFRPWWTDPVIVTITVDKAEGSWAKGQYKFSLMRVQ